jgi:hypothetical protein
MEARGDVDKRKCGRLLPGFKATMLQRPASCCGGPCDLTADRHAHQKH